MNMQIRKMRLSEIASLEVPTIDANDQWNVKQKENFLISVVHVGVLLPPIRVINNKVVDDNSNQGVLAIREYVNGTCTSDFTPYNKSLENELYDVITIESPQTIEEIEKALNAGRVRGR